MKLNLTYEGQDFLLHSLDGGPSPVFSAIVLGEGGDAGEAATSLSKQIMSIAINEIERSDVFVTLVGITDNSSISKNFRATELGVFIEDPSNENNNILFAYGHVDEANAQLIPANTEYPFEIRENVMVYVGATENVSAILSESISTVNRKEFNEHTQNEKNPHKVTAEQVGLGEVPNVSTNDQTPTFTEEKNLANINSGEKVKVLFGKIKKAITELIAHLSNENNPHKVTAAQVGAAGKMHSHTAAEIKSGILSVERGGTGVSRYSELREKINLGNSSGPLKPAYGGTGVTSLGLLREKLGFGYGSGLLETKYGGTGVATYPELREKLGFGKEEGVLGEKYGGTGVESHEKLRQALGLGATLKELGVTFGGTGVSSYVELREKLGFGRSKGALEVEFGGTGAKNQAELASNLSALLLPVFGTYKGDGTAGREIELGFTPSCVILMNCRGIAGDTHNTDYYGGVAYKDGDVTVNVSTSTSYGVNEWDDSYTVLAITDSGFKVNKKSSAYSNVTDMDYVYIAFRKI